MKNTPLNGTKLAVLFMLTYMVSYLTRTNYGAVVVEMVSDTGYTKAALSAALTGSFITYGTGQILVGYLGDRIQPKKLVSLGLLVTVAMNLLLPLCRSPWQMTLIWSINGFAQAFMWPPLTKLMVCSFTGAAYSRAMVMVSYGSSIGTIVVFLLSPLLISLLGWRYVFWFCAICGGVMILAWNRWCVELPAAEAVVHVKQTGTGKFTVTPMLLVIMLAIVFQGALRDGVTTWTPSYISEIYNLGSETAILSSVILPLFGMACHTLASWLFERVFRNPLISGGVLFGCSAAAAVGLYFMTGNQAIGSVLCLAALSGGMHGVNLMLICMIPRYFRERGHVSLVSGLLNSCTYIGSAVSTFGVALLTERIGWKPTVGLWAVTAIVGTALCLAAVPSWKRSMESVRK